MVGVQMIAKLIQEDVPNFHPGTNLYQCGDRHYLVTATSFSDHVRLGQQWGIPISLSHVKPTVEVFLSDSEGVPIDYDGNPANGLTPVLSSDPTSLAGMTDPSITSREEALQVLGYSHTAE